MKIGDKIKFDFAGKKKEGTVSKLFDNTVYLKVDFNKDKQKTVKRKLSQVDSKKSKKKITGLRPIASLRICPPARQRTEPDTSRGVMSFSRQSYVSNS